MRNRKRAKTIVFDVSTNENTREVRATPFTITTGEVRYRVSVDENKVNIYAWSDDLNRWAVIKNIDSFIPGNLEMAISRTLQGNTVEMKAA